jgi:hypothetical protein
MPTWRKLHTKSCESQDIHDMPDDFTRLLWMMLPLGLDREGRGINNPSWVKSKIMPLREDISTEQVRAAMDWYANRKMIEYYTVDNRHYFWIPKWVKYQGDTSKEKASELPPPPVQSNAIVSPEPVQSSARVSSPLDVDVDVDSESEVEVEVEAVTPPPLSIESDEPCLSPLSTAFVNATLIPELTGGPPRWIAALETMQKAGVEPIDVTQAVQELRDRDYSITTLGSIVNAAISVMSKRKTGGKKKHPDGCECDTCLRAYAKWEDA